ncbi:hypothetical protein M3D92_12920 [Micrococcus terreus]|uniref:general stress protein n=1 Tax=Micrococcus terreus TaxID=574650 RepID=UPI0021A5530B|nr:general stress protein [Micrococcus terreus]MCT2090185.1 hypothetical protein [Micrococcus terreus]
MALFAASPSDPNAQGLPRGEVLGTYSSYQQAREVVDQLATGEFDVKQVSIVGTDLRMVERVRGKLTYASVALRSAIQGALFGAMLGLLLSLVDPARAGLQILATAAIGAAIWIIMGVIGMSLRKSRGGGFDSVQQLVPTSFDVVCAFESAAQAKGILRGAAGQGGAGQGSVPAQTPVQQQAPVPPPQQQPSQPQPPAPPQQTAPTPVQDPASGQGATASGSTGSGSHAAPEQGQQAEAVQQQAQAPAAPVAEHQGPTAAMPGQQAPAGSAPTGEAPERDWSYPDLPDGRPQYGVRLPEAEALELRTRILREQGLSENTTGGTEQYQEPAYAKKGRRAKQADEAAAPAPEQSQQPVEPQADAGQAEPDQDQQYRRPRYGRGERPKDEAPEQKPADSDR